MFKLFLVVFTMVGIISGCDASTDVFKFLQKQESFVDHVYCDYCGAKSTCIGGKDCKKNPKGSKKTIGYGFTELIYINKGIMTQKEADQILKKHIEETRKFLNSKIKVKLTKGQESAMISLIFNIGRTNFAKSECLQLINAGKLDEVPANIKRNWHRGNGVPHKLDNRRNAEVKMWNSK